MSVQKPLKCNKLDFFDEGVDEKLWNLYGKVSGLGLEPLTVRLFDEQYYCKIRFAFLETIGF